MKCAPSVRLISSEAVVRAIKSRLSLVSVSGCARVRASCVFSVAKEAFRTRMLIRDTPSLPSQSIEGLISSLGVPAITHVLFVVLGGH